MGKEHIVGIKGHQYKYAYDPDTQSMKYLGPVGSSPPISEEQFLSILEKGVPDLDKVIAGHKDQIIDEKIRIDLKLRDMLQDIQDDKEKYGIMDDDDRERILDKIDDYLSRYGYIVEFLVLDRMDSEAADLLLEAGHMGKDETGHKQSSEIIDHLYALNNYVGVNVYRPVPVKNPKRYDQVRFRIPAEKDEIEDHHRKHPNDVFTLNLGPNGISMFWGLPEYKYMES